MHFVVRVIIVTLLVTCVLNSTNGACAPQTTGPACVTDCRDRAKGDYQSCKGCDVYVICKGNGFIKDSVPCVEEGGQPTYWNPTDGKCTVEKSPLCQLQSVDETTTEQSTSLDGAIYTRWGRTTCPSTATLVYAGTAGGSPRGHSGGGSNYLCLRKDPIFKSARSIPYIAYVYGSEYGYPPINGIHDYEVPCAVCQATRRSVLMIPSRNRCDPGWTTEYTGYLAAEDYRNHRTEFVCMDGGAQPIANTGGDSEGALFYPAVGRCGSLPCPPYIQDRELLCAICTR